ncbi:MAG: LLM class flavin-dependent oxidoreductase, partial [Myxococcaceae bacterium]
MQFSIFIENQIADPTPESEIANFHNCVEQAILADEVGMHRVWVVEHHGMYEYSHSSAPEVFLAYVAAKTKRIRLGHGVVQTPYRYNHPLKVAERAATLDVLSGGRLDLGTGKSGSRTEQDAYEVDRASLHEQWMEAQQMIPQIWQSTAFEWSGKFFNVPKTQVVPKPVQKPHPPLFTSCTSPEQVENVGRLGLGALNFAAGNAAYLKRKVDLYKRSIAEANPKGYQKNNHFALTPNCLVLDDDQEACRYGFRGARFFGEALAQYYQGPHRPLGRLPVHRDFLSDEELQKAKTAQRQSEGGSLLSIIGDPAAAREQVARYAATGCDELILVMQMGTVPHELIMRSIRTFADK